MTSERPHTVPEVQPNDLEHEVDTGMTFNVTAHVYPEEIAKWMVQESGLTRDEMIAWVISVYDTCVK